MATGLLLVCLSGQAWAQLGLLQRLLGKTETPSGEAADSTKVEKVIKPLESYFFDDSLRSRQIFSWTVRPGYNVIDTLAVDTLQSRFEVDYPFMIPDVGSAYLGNLGGASLLLNYFERPERHDFSFLSAYDAYLITPERAPYFNTKRPFTNLSWYMSGQTSRAEEQLRITHAQNISPSTGFNLYYLNRGTKGLYRRQRAKDKNLSLAFGHTGKRYSLFAGYIFNRAEVIENGGIQWDSALGDLEITLPDNIPIRLTDAKNNFRTNTFYVTQAYGIPLQRVTDFDLSIADKSSLFIGHAFEYSTGHRTYTDTRSGSQFPEGDPYNTDLKTTSVNYYDHWYINKNTTLDSLSERRIDNKLFVQIQPWNRDGIVGTIDGGIGFSMHQYYASNMHDEYIYASPQSVDKSDTYLYGSVQGKLRRYVGWSGGVNYHLAGFRSQDIRIDAQLQLSAYIRNRPIRLTVSGFMDSHTADYWTQHYLSNHFIWNNDFSKETETRLQARLDIPSIGLEAGVWQSLTTDKIYYGYAPDKNSDGAEIYTVRPIQDSGNTLSVTGAYLMKNFTLGILHLNHRVLFQKSSDDLVVPLPLVSANASYYLDFTVVRNVMQMQIGVSGYYNTKYYAPAYNPALMQFHNQDRFTTDAQGNARSREIGDYPYLDVFVSAKWKRMRVYAKFQHVNQDLFGTPTYFSVLHYPLNRRMLKFGFSWSFYD
ncbi:MAG: putative porin [Rikenellaceae bacterium]|nr:putative porin [Rikenellaceae bacterium]